MSYTLPRNVLQIIREYSRPMTRPDWRKSKPLTTTYLLFSRTYYIRHYIPEQMLPPSKYALDYRLLCNIIQTNWYYKYERQRQRMIY